MPSPRHPTINYFKMPSCPGHSRTSQIGGRHTCLAILKSRAQVISLPGNARLTREDAGKACGDQHISSLLLSFPSYPVCSSVQRIWRTSVCPPERGIFQGVAQRSPEAPGTRNTALLYCHVVHGRISQSSPQLFCFPTPFLNDSQI